jgi:hypothetical protein
MNICFYCLIDLPQLTLTLGANIRDTIREGSDVYFECTIVANPWVTDVSWLFEGRPLNSDPLTGIIVSNQSLVLQKVRREHRGNYQCAAINSWDGISHQGVSNKIFLKVYCEFFVNIFDSGFKIQII